MRLIIPLLLLLAKLTSATASMGEGEEDLMVVSCELMSSLPSLNAFRGNGALHTVPTTAAGEHIRGSDVTDYEGSYFHSSTSSSEACDEHFDDLGTFLKVWDVEDVSADKRKYAVSNGHEFTHDLSAGFGDGTLGTDVSTAYITGRNSAINKPALSIRFEGSADPFPCDMVMICSSGDCADSTSNAVCNFGSTLFLSHGFSNTIKCSLSNVNTIRPSFHFFVDEDTKAAGGAFYIYFSADEVCDDPFASSATYYPDDRFEKEYTMTFGTSTSNLNVSGKDTFCIIVLYVNPTNTNHVGSVSATASAQVVPSPDVEFAPLSAPSPTPVPPTPTPAPSPSPSASPSPSPTPVPPTPTPAPPPPPPSSSSSPPPPPPPSSYGSNYGTSYGSSYGSSYSPDGSGSDSSTSNDDDDGAGANVGDSDFSGNTNTADTDLDNKSTDDDESGSPSWLIPAIAGGVGAVVIVAVGAIIVVRSKGKSAVDPGDGNVELPSLNAVTVGGANVAP